MIALLKSWLDSNEFAWMPPRWWRGSAYERLIWRLRRLARRRLCAQLIARQGLARTVVQNLAWPFLAPVKAALHLRTHPEAVRGGPFAALRRWLDLCRLQLAYNIRIGDQTDFRLDLPGHRPLARGMTVCREQQALLGAARELAREDNEIDRKLPFARSCRAAGLPHIALVCEGRGPHVAHHASPWPARDLFFKPADMGKGRGAEVLAHDAAQGLWRTRDGLVVTPETIGPFATARIGADEAWLLQPRLVNSPLWAVFGGHALNTCRVVTGRLSAPDADPVVLGAYLRFGVNDAIVDNLAAGGVGVCVDPASGRLGYGLRWQNLQAPITDHPLTGRRFEGELLPGWTEIAALAVRAHRSAGRWCAIGWDIPLLPEGPALVEANLQWAANPFLAAARIRLPEVYQGVFGPDFARFPG